jgi:hypothetical protein
MAGSCKYGNGPFGPHKSCRITLVVTAVVILRWTLSSTVTSLMHDVRVI